MIPEVNLSNNDAHVLTALFDPEAAPTTNLKVDPSLPAYPNLEQTTIFSLQALELEAIRPLNVQNPPQSSLYQAIDALTEIINQQPTYCSAYANRAQARRLVIGDDVFSVEMASETEKLFEDLEACIYHATPRSPASPLSPQQAKLLATVHTHRGYLLMKASTEAGKAPLEIAQREIKGRSKDDLEEMASRDFFFGGRYGDRTAKEMSVRTNPYAKMCGSIVKEAMRKEMEEYEGLRA